MEKLHQYGRRNNVIVNNIPFMPEENVRELIKELAACMEVPINNADIVAVHRPPSKSQAPSLIAKFVNRDTKINQVKASKNRRIDGSRMNFTLVLPIFCDDDLTKYTQHLAIEAKKLRQQGIVKYAWIREGVVKIRVDDNTPVIKIKHPAQLKQFTRGDSQLIKPVHGHANKRTVEERSPYNDYDKDTRRKLQVNISQQTGDRKMVQSKLQLELRTPNSQSI